MASRIRIPSSFATLRRPATLGAAGLLLLLGFGLLSSSACTLSTSGIDNGTGGTSATSSTSSTGGNTGCMDDSECMDGNPCTRDVCNKGTCENPADDSVMPTDPNPCTKDVCKDGVQSHPFLPAGTPCGMNLKCDAGGICQCTHDDQCGMPTSCIKPTCDMAKGCVMVLPMDTLADPTPNDCKGIKCDGMGHEVAYNEDADKPVDDGVVCTDDACAAGMGTHPASAVGTPCMGSNVCKAPGMCVFCTGNFGCNVAGGEYCFNEAACASCTNAVKDGDETDVGCGGTTCPKCDVGKACLVVGDCASGKCNSGLCISCGDGIQNGDESDVDCGGTCATKCADGKTCSAGTDCDSGKCAGTKCISCGDGIKNGSETDVDCGGSCGKCAISKGCGSGADCTSTFCAEGVCCGSACGGTCLSCNLPGKIGACGVVPSGLSDPGTCMGGMLCDGGGTCANNGGKKAIGVACANNGECFNNNCLGVCRLAVGDPCSTKSDCASYLCTNNLCAACGSDNDCPSMNTCVGAPAGTCKLSLGEKCNGNGDCESGHCNGGPPKVCNPT